MKHSASSGIHGVRTTRSKQQPTVASLNSNSNNGGCNNNRSSVNVNVPNSILTDSRCVEEEAAAILPLDEIKVDPDQLVSASRIEAEEFLCKICHSFLVGCAPKLTKCSHLFCGDCLEQWIRVQPTMRSWAQVAKTVGARQVPCPVCKTPLNDKTEIFLITSGDTVTPECQALAKVLNRFKIKCHNSPDLDPLGKCRWTGIIATYQVHALSCRMNGAGVVCSRNAIDPSVSRGPSSADVYEDEHSLTSTNVFPASLGFDPIRYTHEFCGNLLYVQKGDLIRVVEKPEGSQWMLGINTSKDQNTEGWFPHYCFMRLDEFVENEGLIPIACQQQYQQQSQQGDGNFATCDSKNPPVLAERSAILRDFDPAILQKSSGTEVQNFLSVSEGEVVLVWQRRTRAGWNLCVSGDGTRMGWVPDNRCKTIREGTGYCANSDAPPRVAEISRCIPAHQAILTCIAKNAYNSRSRSNEISVAIGDLISVRGKQVGQRGWTLGSVVHRGGKREGWFPEWVIN